MKESLYGILGIKKDSDSQSIKKAYRNKSKTLHPDCGGSQEDFNSISKAYRILIDDEKRSRYDSGENEDDILRSAASEHTIIQNMLAQLFCSLVEQINPDTDDVIAFMVNIIDTNMLENQSSIKKLESIRSKFEKTSKKVKSKKNNLLKDVALSKINNISRDIKTLQESGQNLLSCKKYLEDFSYEVDIAPFFSIL